MLLRLANRDNVAVAGSLIGLASLLFGWLTLKPNRIAAGTDLTLWQGFDWTGAAVIIALWVLGFGFSLSGRNRPQALSLGIIANVIIIASFLFAGLSATRLLEQEAAASTRVSLGAGFWVTLAGAYVVIFGARQIAGDSRFWKNAITWTGLSVTVLLLLTGWLNNLSVMQEFIGREERFFQELLQHVFLFGGSVVIGTIIGVSLGIWATRSRRAEKPVFYFSSITQTIPSLALFGLLIAPLSALSFSFPVLRDIGIRGVGPAPAFIALVIYSLLPIVRNTYVSLRQVDPAVIDAGLGMGMSRRQVFRKVEIPLATPIVLEGVRIASVQSVGLAAIAALIGAGGLGWFIFRGVGQAANDLILLGAIPIIILALVVDATMRAIIKAATPKGLAGVNQ
jgi:osmoprotectant transport system permease protein